MGRLKNVVGAMSLLWSALACFSVQQIPRDVGVVRCFCLFLMVNSLQIFTDLISDLVENIQLRFFDPCDQFGREFSESVSQARCFASAAQLRPRPAVPFMG